MLRFAILLAAGALFTSACTIVKINKGDTTIEQVTTSRCSSAAR
jgi:hypothetical protein